MKVKNNSGTEKVWVGQTIEAGAYYTIQTPLERIQWQSNDVVITDIASGDLVMNDEFSDLSPAAGLMYLMGA